jgi:two-component system sensor histidine kinase BarA
MSYRSLKRVLGETNLERKCRFLFGACLLLLITGAFWWVSTVTERLAKNTARTTGRRSVDSILMKQHWLFWETSEGMNELARELTSELPNQEYEHQILSLDGASKTSLPADQEEREIVLRLQQKLREQEAAEAARLEKEAAEGDGNANAPVDSLPGKADLDSPDVADFEDDEELPVYEERWLRDEGEYNYYQPVYWKSGCISCHRALMGDALPAGEAAEMYDQKMKLRVVKVVIPDAPLQRAIEWTRAILIATGIITVFVSMVALYIIVRYVIVKPLTHLRDVSDEISRGNLQLRADIHTGDEFEHLADSFNRMLRSLVDTQQELREVNTDLDGKVDELAQANLRLYEMNRMKSDFLASMSHELRTPLNSILGFSDVLRGIDSLNDKQKRYVANIQTSGRALLEMINDILDLAKMESGKMDVRPVEFQLDPVIRAQCDVMRSLTEDKNLDLDCDVETDLPPVFQDQGKVQQILTNLLSNAVKFTPEGGRIHVKAGRGPHGQLVISVADTGVGIAEDDREIIFEKFRQSQNVAGDDNLTREFSGTGLGLSIVKELCILLGGEVSFVSELGKGSEFTIRLPWSTAHQGPSEPRSHDSSTDPLMSLSST